jgi:hypothetical protein
MLMATYLREVSDDPRQLLRRVIRILCRHHRAVDAVGVRCAGRTDQELHT